MANYCVITLFPELIAAFRQTGIVRRACEAGLAAVETITPRDFAENARGAVDDSPYGGGPGMVMQVTPLRAAIAAARKRSTGESQVIYLSPQGERFDQACAERLAHRDNLVLICGRYEGVDERLLERDIDLELSLGDFVLSGGEVAAMAVIDTIIRLLPGALGHAQSALEDSFTSGVLDYPHYTRPEVVDGQPIPSVLLSGDHAAIARWRRKQALGRTWLRRPDLLAAVALTREDLVLLDEFKCEHQRNSSSRD